MERWGWALGLLWLCTVSADTSYPAPIVSSYNSTNSALNVMLTNNLTINVSWFCALYWNHFNSIAEMVQCDNTPPCRSAYGGDIPSLAPGQNVSIYYSTLGSNLNLSVDCIYVISAGVYSDIARLNVSTAPFCADVSNPCGGSECIDTVDATHYRCAPTFFGGVTLDTPPTQCGLTYNVTLNTTAGTQRIYVCLAVGMYTVINDFQGGYLSFGTRAQPRRYICTEFEVAFLDVYFLLSCVPSPGVGRGNVITLTALIQNYTFNVVSTAETFSYPDPIILDNTLRFSGGQPGNILLPSSLNPVLIEFDVLNVALVEQLAVYYGTAENPSQYRCGLQPDTNFTMIQCLTDPSNDYNPEPFRFSVVVPGYSVRGSDQLDLPSTFPRITYVLSDTCAVNSALGSVYNCPTRGFSFDRPVTLTIVGYNFNSNNTSPKLVVVGSSRCEIFYSAYVADPLEIIICGLPPGTGNNQAVFIQSGVLASPARALVSYAAPNVTGLCGCDTACVSPQSDIAACARNGSVKVDIFGTNFGASDASVLIGSDICLGVAHDPVTPHEHISCFLPPGALTSRSVLVTQFNGANSAGSVATVSYLQCAAGQYQKGSTTACVLCDIGKFSALAGQTTCLTCDPGTIAPHTNRTACSACPAGTFQNISNATSCKPCPAGSAAPGTGSSQCTACLAGTYADQPKATKCRPCALGTYQQSSNATSCDVCPVGSTAEQSAIICTACPPGTRGANSSANESTISCVDCPVGTYQKDSNQSVCVLCSVGKANELTGQNECLTCKDNSIADEGQSICTRCPAGSIAINEASLCACKSSTYLVGNGSTAYCAACVQGMKCDELGVTVENAVSLPGFIRVSSDAVSFQQCLFAAYCPGDGTTCAAYRSGPLCNLCAYGYRPVTGQGACEECPRAAVSAGNIAGVCLALLVGVVVLYVVVVRSDLEILTQAPRKEPKKVWYAESSKSHSRESVAPIVETGAPPVAMQQPEVEEEHLGESILTPHLTRMEKRLKVSVSYQFKIVITFIQLVTALTAFNQITWPPTFLTFINAFDFVNLSFLPWNYIGCLQRYVLFDKILFMACVPVILLVIFMLPLFLYLHCRDKFDDRDTESGRQDRVRRRGMLYKCVVFTIFLCYPAVSRQIAAYFRCVGVDTAQGGVEYYLQDSFSERCYDDAWLKNLGWVLVLALLYPFCVPFGLFLVLKKYHHRFEEPFIKFSLGLAFSGFHARLWWFEVLDMVHKLVLGSIVALISGPGQWVTGMIVAALYALVLILLNPYIRSADNRLHLLAQANIFLLILSLRIGQYDTIESGSVQDVFISLLLIAIVFTVFVYFLFRIALHIKRTSHRVRRWLYKREAKSKNLVVGSGLMRSTSSPSITSSSFLA